MHRVSHSRAFSINNTYLVFPLKLLKWSMQNNCVGAYYVPGVHGDGARVVYAPGFWRGWGRGGWLKRRLLSGPRPYFMQHFTANISPYIRSKLLHTLGLPRLLIKGKLLQRCELFFIFLSVSIVKLNNKKKKKSLIKPLMRASDKSIYYLSSICAKNKAKRRLLFNFFRKQ